MRSFLAGWTLALAALMTAPALAAAPPASTVPGYPEVLGEYLQTPGYAAPGTPKSLNSATFLRLRLAADGDAPKPANAVIVALPGFSSTPSQWIFLASQMVKKAPQSQCEGKPCRMEVWVLQRRGAHLADTSALIAARKAKDPAVALKYYYGTPVTRPGPGPGAPARILAPGPDAAFKALTQTDLSFMADWGFQAYAGDVDAMIGLIKTRSGARNIFLAGHSQGGGFVANYAARLQPDGKRGVDKLAGLIFLDGGPSAGGEDKPTEAQLNAYFSRVNDLRSGKSRVYTDGNGLLGPVASLTSFMGQSVTGLYYAFSDPNAEAIFPMRAVGSAPAPGDDFLNGLRVSWLARAGVTFDTEPVPGGAVQLSVLRFLGQGLGRLDFTPLPGTEALCDKTPEPPMLGPPRTGPAVTCTPTAAMLNPAKVYGWIEGGGNGGVAEPSKAMLWLQAQAWAPSRTNVRPATATFAQSGPRTLDASSMVAFNWYQSERWDFDANFVGRYKTLKIDRDGVQLDLDKSVIAAIPVYVARQSTAPRAGNPFPGVIDYTEINKAGTFQSDAAKALTPLNPTINATIYNHTDFIAADDSTPDKGTPGDPGNAVVPNTLTDWVLKRSKGAATTPTPRALGVRDVF